MTGRERTVGAGLTAAIVVALALAIAFGLPADRFQRHAASSDLEMYASIAGAMRGGEAYLHAAVRILHGNGGPVNPPWTVRLPTLAWLMSVTTERQLSAIHALLATVSAVTWMIRLRMHARGLIGKAILVGSVTCAHYYAILPTMTPLHESWAGTLVSIALATRRARMWWPAMMAAAAACIIRETAITVVAVMALCALVERHGREAMAWTVLGVVVGVGYAWHFDMVRDVVEAAGLSGETPRSWWGMWGPGYALRDGVFATGLAFLPMAIGCTLALTGCAAWLLTRNPMTVRVAAYLLMWTAIMSILPDRVNFYWAAMYAQLIPMGLTLVPALWARGRESEPEG